jgi:ATP-dependent exoDNAse (exonuclease V) beta subunit
VARREDLTRELLSDRQARELEALENALGGEALEAVGEAMVQLVKLADKPSLNNEITDAWAAPDRHADVAMAAEATWRVLVPLRTASGDLMSPRSINSKVFPGSNPERAGIVDQLKERVEGWRNDPAACEAFKRFTGTPPLDLVPGNDRLLEQLRELLKQAVAELTVTFADRGICDFPHVAQQALAALGDELAPSEALLIEDGRLSHILIDEFQDTSKLQYDLVRKLVSGWTPGDGRTLFLVGDPMQSIYGFRKANVGLFRTVMEEGRIGDVPLETCRLEVNFRSTQPVIADVNDTCAELFRATSEASPGHVAYQPVEAFRGSGGNVRTRAFLAAEDRAAAREAEARWIAEDIEANLATGEVRTVGVLARMRSQLEPVARALDEQGIAYEAVEIESLGQRPLVLDLLTVTRALLHPGDRVAWVGLLVAPWCALQPAELLDLLGEENTADVLSRCGTQELLERLPSGPRARVQRLATILRAYMCQGPLLSLAQRVESAWVALGGPRLAVRPEDLEDAERFLALLAQLDSEHPEDLLGELERRLPRLYAASRTAPVQLMTIHKAKGLEFDAVYLPALQARPRRGDRQLFRQHEMPVHGDEHASLLAPVKASGDSLPSLYDYLGLLEQDAQTSEAQRLLYVAMTRARRFLRLSAVVRQKGDGGLARETGSFLTLLHDRFEALLTDAEPIAGAPRESGDPRPLLRLETAEAAWSVDQEFIQATSPAEPVTLGDAMPDRNRLALGEALHHWFELIHDHWSERWLGDWFEDHAPALRSSLRLAGASVDQLEPLHAELVTLLKARLADPVFRAMLSPEQKPVSRAEALYLAPGGDRLRRRIIDRLYQDSAGDWHIVDYKTGSDSEVTRQRWANQLAVYGSAVAAAENGQVVETSILTAEDGRFIDPGA